MKLLTKAQNVIDRPASQIIQTQKRERRHCIEENKRRLITALRGTPILSVRMNFDGSGDEGCVDQPEAWGVGNRPCEIPEVEIEWLTASSIYANALTITLKLAEAIKVKLPEAIKALANAYLEVSRGGWEVEDVARSEFRIDVANGTVKLEYFERFIDTNCSEATF